MTKLTVNELINIIIKGTNQKRFADYFKEQLLESLDFMGGNEHIQNPLNHPMTEFYWQHRKVPLTGEEIVYGDYLLFDYAGHDGDAFIWSFDSLDQIEDKLLSDGGISNTFTTYMVVIEFRMLKEY